MTQSALAVTLIVEDVEFYSHRLLGTRQGTDVVQAGKLRPPYGGDV